MRHANFIVDKSVDEFKSIQVRSQQNRYDNSTFGLTVLPTMNCNFKCTYCFEEKTNISMSDETSSNLIKLVNNRFKQYHTSSLGVTWFGGEPLLEYERILELSDKMIEMCTINNVQFNSSMISNCWLLSTEKAKKLSDHKISNIQVTLDGPPSLHDKKRVTASGGKTFDRILEIIAECSSIIPIVIRFNIDKESVAYFDDFFESVKILKGLKGISIYPGCVTSEATKACSSIEGICLDVPSFAKVSYEFYKGMIINGYPLSWFPKSNFHLCGAVRINSYVVQPDGCLCRCWDQVGQFGESHSNINDKEFFNGENFYKWVLYDPFTIEECKECIFFPLCKGGCPARRITPTTEYMDTNHDGKCATYKYNMKEMLLLVYNEFLKKEALKTKAIPQ